MEIINTRYDFSDKRTFGKCSIDGRYFSHVLEDAVREVKIAGKTAIPYGRHRVVIDWSGRFKRMMLHILDVPNFAGIRIHSGETEADTEGCPLVGFVRDVDRIHPRVTPNGPRAADVLQEMVSEAINRGEDVWWTSEHVNKPGDKPDDKPGAEPQPEIIPL